MCIFVASPKAKIEAMVNCLFGAMIVTDKPRVNQKMKKTTTYFYVCLASSSDEK